MKHMRTSGLLILLLVVGLVAIAGCSSSGSSSGNTQGGGSTGGTASGTAAVVAKNFAFSPATVQITVGGSVTWTNEDSATHNVQGDGGIASGDLAQGANYTKKFDTAGTYNYHCSIHPTMTGQVIVK